MLLLKPANPHRPLTVWKLWASSKGKGISPWRCVKVLSKSLSKNQFHLTLKAVPVTSWGFSAGTLLWHRKRWPASRHWCWACLIIKDPTSSGSWKMATEVFPKVIPGVIFSIRSQKRHRLSRAPSWETFLSLCISHTFVLMPKFRKPFSVQ